MTDAVDNIAAVPAARKSGQRSSAKALWRHLVWLYVVGSVAAVVVVFSLALLGLELTLYQWGALLSTTPFGVLLYLVPDIVLIFRHYKPVGAALAKLDRGETPTPAEASAALARALNLPFYSFVRVTFVHGPMATVALVTVLFVLNATIGTGYATWQIFTFAATVLFFAAPTHAIFEYFSISRDLTPVIARLWPLTEGGVRAEHQKELVAIRLGSKLLYLSIFVAALPLVFFGASIIFKVDLLLHSLGVNAESSVMMPLWLWVFGVVAVCMAGLWRLGLGGTAGAAVVPPLGLGVCGAGAVGRAASPPRRTLPAAGVSRPPAARVEAMPGVEGDKPDADLHITPPDEYAALS